MIQSTISFYVMEFYKQFAAYTTQQLQEFGLSFGMMYFVIYVGKHPGCTPAEMTKNLHLDWGHCQRSVIKLVEDGFMTREKQGRSYHLGLTPAGERAFRTCHQVFFDWDAQNLSGLTEEEQHHVFDAFERLSNAAAKDGFGLGLAIVHNIVTMLHGKIRLNSEKGKGSRFMVEIPMQKADDVPEQVIQTYIHRKDRNLNVIAIDNDEVLLLMQKEMYAQEGIHCDTCTDAAELMEMLRRKEYNLLLTDLNMPGINGFELLELLRSSNVGNSQIIPVVVATASGSCDAEELLAKGFAGCLFKPFSISELMEVSDKCGIKETLDGKPDLSTLLSYGNEAVMLEKLITETEKEMRLMQDAATRNDLQELDALTHHLRSSWEVLRADQPLRELYGLLHGKAIPEESELSHAVTAVLNKGAEIIRLAKEERRKYENG